MNAVRSPRSPSAGVPPRGDTSPPLLTDGPDLGLERDAELPVHALAREVHERLYVGGRGASAVHDEIGVLGGHLRPVDPLALEPDLLDQAARLLSRRVPPHTPDGGQRQRLRGLLVLEPVLDLFL